MNNKKLHKTLKKTWKQLLDANVHHDEANAYDLFKKMLQLEIEQKKQRHH